MMAGQSLEPHGLHSPKAHLCEYGYAILKNALAFDN